jgi:hypothetical protein
MLLSDNIKDDLELSDATKNNSLYNSLFTNEHDYAKCTSDLWSEYYTDDKKYLKDTQKLLSKTHSVNVDVLQCWNHLKGDHEFNDRYQFINIKYFEFLNHNSMFLQMVSIYKFASPLISLIYPIFILFVPLLILKYFNGIDISFSQYFSIMKIFIMNNSLVKLFTEFSLTNWRQSFYLLFSACMYIFSIYQNIVSCISFHKNMKNINKYIIELTKYMEREVNTMNRFQDNCSNLSTYKPFLQRMNKHKQILLKSINTFSRVDDYKWNYNNLSCMGYSMKLLYHIYYNRDFHDAIMYSFGFNGYLLNIQDIQTNIHSKYINKVSFGKSTKFKEAYYPIFKGKKHIKNNCSLKNNVIISGPNASGKTTLIKTILFNVLLSQQIGYGFYKTASIKLYKHIHSYLNIPDTSDRDSLFQAEARRCREIINSLEKNKNHNHFCIFDELYSGTNPYEATASAYAFIKYMLKKNIDFMLTTHFVELCENLNDVNRIENSQMDIVVKDDIITYLYNLKPGISKHRGGVHVLKQLRYPEEIIIETKNYLNR